MYSIGQFSIMLNINKKTLRYYDDIELFKPIYVDVNNQYRYYDESQIPVIKRIVDLKNIGISLEQIKNIINKGNSVSLHETYLVRLNEIEIMIEQLNAQRVLIQQCIEGIVDKQVCSNSYTVEQGLFIEEGYVYYNELNCDFEDVNSVIGDFYANNKGETLRSGHIFKKNLDDFSKSVSEIFAYTNNNDEKINIRHQKQLLCLKVVCDSLSKKESAMKTLFDYSCKNNLSIDAIFEKYVMLKGRMTIEIIGSIK